MDYNEKLNIKSTEDIAKTISEFLYFNGVLKLDYQTSLTKPNILSQLESELRRFNILPKANEYFVLGNGVASNYRLKLMHNHLPGFPALYHYGLRVCYTYTPLWMSNKIFKGSGFDLPQVNDRISKYKTHTDEYKPQSHYLSAEYLLHEHLTYSFHESLIDIGAFDYTLLTINKNGELKIYPNTLEEDRLNSISCNNKIINKFAEFLNAKYSNFNLLKFSI